MRGPGRRLALAARKVKPTTQIVPAGVVLVVVSVLWLGASPLAGLIAAALPTPAPPSNLIAIPASTGIYLQWDASPTPAREISEYRLERFREGDSAAVIIKRLPVGRLSHFDSTGLGGIPYRYRVRARDWFLNDSPWSDPVVASFRDAVLPDRPDSMMVTVNPQGLFVDWAPGTDADLARYRVYRAIEGSVWHLLAESEESQYLDRAAEIATPYLYATTSVDHSENESARSDTVRGVIPDGVPPAVVPVFSAVGEPGGIRLSWQPPGDLDLAGFRIARSTNPVFSDPLAQLDRTVTEFVDTTARERRFYIYRIVAFDNSGNSGEAVFASAIRPDVTAPAAPVLLGTEQSESGLKLQWAPSSSADLAHYRLLRESLVDTTRVATRMDASLTEYIVFPFSTGLPRRYSVTAVDSAGNESAPAATIESALVPGSFSRGRPDVRTQFRLVALPGGTPGIWEFPGERGGDWEALDPLTLEPAARASKVGVPVWAMSTQAWDPPPERSMQVVGGGLDFVYTLPVSSGWNALSSPFDIPLDWNLVLAWNEVSGPLLRHNGHWQEGHVLEPYEGAYWFNRSEKSSLDLPYAVERLSADTVAAIARVVIRAAPASGGLAQFVEIGEAPDQLLPPTPGALSVFALDMDTGEALLRKSVGVLPGARAQLDWRGPENIITVSIAEKPPGLTVRLTDELGTTHSLDESGTLLNVLSGTFQLEIAPLGAPVATSQQFGLAHVFPRPASTPVTVVYRIGAPGPVTLSVFDLLGRRVVALEERWRAPGQYQARWVPAVNLPNGTYVVSLTGSEGRSTQSLQLLR